MKTNVWINLKWKDFQLNWSTADYKIGSVRVPHEKVWVMSAFLKLFLIVLWHFEFDLK
jgi:hypothetical protein